MITRMLCLIGLALVLSTGSAEAQNHHLVRINPNQIIGRLLQDGVFTGVEIYEFQRVMVHGRVRTLKVPVYYGWIVFTTGREKYRTFVIDPKGAVGNLVLLSERDPNYRQKIRGPRWRFKVPNRPGGPINEDYHLVLEDGAGNQQCIFTFTVENSAPPDLDGGRW